MEVLDCRVNWCDTCDEAKCAADLKSLPKASVRRRATVPTSIRAGGQDAGSVCASITARIFDTVSLLGQLLELSGQTSNDVFSSVCTSHEGGLHG